MEIELKLYNRYARDIKFLLIASGIWPNFNPIFDRICSFLAACITFFMSIGFIGLCVKYISNVIILTKGIGQVISASSCFLKICIFRLHYNDLLYLNNFLSTRFLQDLNNPDHRYLLLYRISIFSKFFYILTIATGIVILLLIRKPALLIIKGIGYPLLIPAYFPFVYQPGGSVYWMMILEEILSSFFVFVVTCGSDSLFGLYALQMCGELRVLAHKFENLQNAKDYQKDLQECIERHHMLIKSRDALQRIYGFISIWIAITSAFVQCSLAYQAKVELKTLSPYKMFMFFFYMILKIVQSFSYAWYGSLLTEESEYCRNAIYNAQWPGSKNFRFMKDVLIVLTQKPLSFRAKGFMNVHMDMFTKIMNTSISYFFLLKTLDETKNV